MTVVKICGLMRLEDALFAAEAGADMLGFILAPISKRYMPPAQVRPIVERIKATYDEKAPLCVGVFVAPAHIDDDCRASGLDAAQVVGLSSRDDLAAIHTPTYLCIRPETPEQALTDAAALEQIDLPIFLPTLQLDGFHPNLYGGTGHTQSPEIMQTVAQRTQRLMLAGGLTPDNVAYFIQQVQPWAVDVASGTEASIGIKDLNKVRNFIHTAKGIQQ